MIALLPECIASVVVCEWLEVESIVRLDSAHCGRQQREQFLNLCMFQSISTLVKCHGSVLAWLIKRKITVAKFDVCDVLNEHEKSLFKQYTEQSGGEIRAINVGCFDVSVGAAVVQNCNSLTALSCGRIDALDLARLLKNNPKLNRLDVVGIRGGHFGGFRDISLPELTSLRVVVPDRFTGGDCTNTGALVACTPNLEKLSIEHDGCGPRPTVPIIHTSCTHLRSLQLSQIDNIGVNLTQIVVLCPNVVNLQFMYCKNLSDDDMLLVAKSLHQLRTVSVMHCRAVTALVIQHLTDNCSKTLELLHLSAGRCTRASMDYAREKCPKLKVQVVGSCFAECDYDIVQLVNTITHLETYFQLSDSFINSVIFHASLEVVFLNAASDTLLSSQGIMSLCTKWPCLRVLVVQKDDEARFTELARHVPHLTIATNRWEYSYNIMDMPI